MEEDFSESESVETNTVRLNVIIDLWECRPTAESVVLETISWEFESPHSYQF